jgi:hypothetical protein
MAIAYQCDACKGKFLILYENSSRG